MKKTFLEYQRPLLCAMVQDETPVDCICTIVDSLYDGAEAFGIQLCNLLPEYRNEESLKKIFSYLFSQNKQTSGNSSAHLNTIPI